MKQNHNFFNISLEKKEDSQVLCYRSGTLVYEESFFCGALLSSGYNSAGYPLNVLMSFPTRLNKNHFTEPFAFNIEIDGQAVDFDLEFAGFETVNNENSVEGILVLKSKNLYITVSIQYMLHSFLLYYQFFAFLNYG